MKKRKYLPQRKKRNYLSMYEEYMETGSLITCGLCNEFGYYCNTKKKWICDHPSFELFIPTEEELTIDMINNHYWAFDGVTPFTTLYNVNPNFETEFTPLRQTIVLLMAAMNNEL